jgi:hypothetical protein
LTSRNTDEIETVKPKRKRLPDDFARLKIPQGDSVMWRKNKLLALKWKDKKDVYLLSSFYDKLKLNKSEETKEINKQKQVIDYNDTMGGVDLSDQSMTYYPIVRKQEKKFYKKIFRNLIEQCLWMLLYYLMEKI